ncbi:MAG: DUF3108 domain-containing protein [Verrucomicrobiota bacterium]|nr:MAG: DUF3108 domain-containing protein [Verrucomicrobiota bacterium]
MKPFFIVLSLLFTGAAVHAAPPLALKDGEALEYKVDWAVLPGAGLINIHAKKITKLNEAPSLSILTETSTRNLARTFLKFDAKSESIFDLASGHLMYVSESSYARGRSRSHSVTFSYKDHTALYKDDVSQTLHVPEGFPTDLITCLLSTRNLNMRPGQTHDALVLFGTEFYDLTIHAIGYEELETPLGAYRTLILEPRMEHSPPKGMFKKGTTVRVWISQDSNPLPIRFRVDFKFGAGLANLVRYTPPHSTTTSLKP